MPLLLDDDDNRRHCRQGDEKWQYERADQALYVRRVMKMNLNSVPLCQPLICQRKINFSQIIRHTADSMRSEKFYLKFHLNSTRMISLLRREWERLKTHSGRRLQNRKRRRQRTARSNFTSAKWNYRFIHEKFMYTTLPWEMKNKLNICKLNFQALIEVATVVELYPHRKSRETLARVFALRDLSM